MFEHEDHHPQKEAWPAFEANLDYVPISAGPAALKEAVERAEKACVEHGQIVHYLSVPPNAALSAIKMLSEAGLAGGSRVIMEKPFGTDLESAIALNDALHKVFAEEQIFRIDHFLGKEPAQNILAFRFGNGLFEPIWNRNFIDHVQIDVPETLDIGNRTAFYEQTGAYRDMVVTHLFQILAFTAMEPPTSLAPGPISEEKNKVFRSLIPIDPAQVVRGQFIGYRKEPGVDPESDTETFIALKAQIDNWRWAGVPFYLRTGKRMAEGQRIISIAFREPPKSMFPKDSGVGLQGPDHLTFDLADQSRVSLSFYGKRPGPGMRLDKQSMQFTIGETPTAATCSRLTSGSFLTPCAAITRCSAPRTASSDCGKSRSRCSNRPRRSRSTRLAPGDRSRSISWSRRTRGDCRSNARGATPIWSAVDARAAFVAVHAALTC